MENKENESVNFSYTYSARQQDEIKAIRSKYVSPEEEDKMSRLRRLDAEVTKKASSASLAVGIIGALILGFGMSLFMSELGAILGSYRGMAVLVGTAIGIVGIFLICSAYPLYNHIVKKQRQKIAPEILRLADELIK